jgi:hypothetical protein
MGKQQSAEATVGRCLNSRTQRRKVLLGEFVVAVKQKTGQLAFDCGEACEACPGRGEGRKVTAALSCVGTLAQSLIELELYSRWEVLECPQEWVGSAVSMLVIVGFRICYC